MHEHDLDQGSPIQPNWQWAAVAFAIGLPTLVTLAYFDWLAHFPAAVQQSAYAVGKVVQFGFPAFWVFVILRQRPRRQTWKPNGLAAGLGFGLLVMASMLALYFLWLGPQGFLDTAAQEVRQKVTDLGIGAVPVYAVVALFYSLVHSLLEEYYWRWFVFARLRELTRLPTAIIVSSLGFMAHHVLVLATFFGWSSPATYLFSLAVAVGGGVWAWIYHRYGSLVGPWASHLLVDAGIFIIGYQLIN